MESFTEVKDRRETNQKRAPQQKRGGNRGGNRGGANQGGYRPKTAATEDDVQMQEPVAQPQQNRRQGNRSSRGGAGEQQTTETHVQAAAPKQAHPEEEKKGANGQAAKHRKAPKINKNPATEEGFVGESDTWFDDIAFKKQLIQDLTYNDEKHDYYFGSYSHFYIHEEMLKDQIRTNAYRHAIEGNAEDFKDKIVLDIGAGTGILSIFAAKAGAKHVYAIENAEIAHFAREIIKKNGLEDKITVIKGKMEEIVLPVQEVDIIISEWMGYFLLYESMLDSVLWARDKYLNKKSGKMLPDRCQIYIAALEDESYKANKQHFWRNVYDVDMSIMTPVVLKEPCIDYLNAYENDYDFKAVISNPCEILDLDLVRMKKGDVNFTSKYNLKINKASKVSAVIAWFDCHFEDLKRKVTLSTSPFAPYTHWKNTIFYLDQPQIVAKDDVMSGSIAVRQSKENFRELDVKFSFHFTCPGTKPVGPYVQLYKVR